MEFVGFSFHFMLMADCKKVKAAVARIQKDCHYAKASQVRGGIDVASLRVGEDYFYARWLKPIKLISAQVWVKRVIPEVAMTKRRVQICGHTTDPLPDADFSLRYKLTKAQSGSKSPFHAMPASCETAATAQATADTQTATPVLAARLPTAVAATKTDKELINSPSSCWSLGLLSRENSLMDRAARYTLGEYISQGSYGIVYHATYNGPPAVQCCVKQIKNDTANLQASRIEMYALERCNDSEVGVVRLLDVFLEGSPAKVHLVLELWPHNLYTYFVERRASPLEIRSAMRDTIAGLAFLHGQLQLVHCDVKNTNILARPRPSSRMPDVQCVLGDLGAVMQVHHPYIHLGYFGMGGAFGLGSPRRTCRGSPVGLGLFCICTTVGG